MNLSWLEILGIFASIATIIGTIYTFMASTNKQIIKTGSQSSTNLIQNSKGDIQINQVYETQESIKRKSPHCVPKSFLLNLPKIKYNTYLRAGKYWDSGVTCEMLEGNRLVVDKLYEILLELSELSGNNRINGKSAKDYYKEKIKNLTNLAFDAQPIDGGTMHVLIADSHSIDIVQEFIVNLVQTSCEKDFFNDWIQKWNNAEKFAIGNRTIDINLTNEL